MNQPKELCSDNRFIKIPHKTVPAHDAPTIDLNFPLFHLIHFSNRNYVLLKILILKIIAGLFLINFSRAVRLKIINCSNLNRYLKINLILMNRQFILTQNL